MSSINTYPMGNSTILRLNSERDVINISPDYQRQGGIWTKEKKQLLIDSILNDYDIPKLYFHKLNLQQKNDDNNRYDYSIIDGRQRIESIWEFIDGNIALSDDFYYQGDSNVNAAGLTYQGLASEYPKLKIRFDSYILPVILVETEDIDLIEDMFSRLNEAVPLNAAEKRNAFGGEMAKAIREIANNSFFTSKVKFGNNRYQHREIASRFLFIELSLQISNKIYDTKKPYLDKMVIDYSQNTIETNQFFNAVSRIVNIMSTKFENSDWLLRAQSVMSVYYLVFRDAIENGWVDRINRNRLLNFFTEIEQNRTLAEEDITRANFELLEYDRLSIQSTNDASNIRERARVLSDYLQD